ncbi:HDOD domain-containing protein [Thermopirellula anaerolimosa]
MKRIYFVDDEPRVVDGLRRMLRSQRDEWEMSFFHSGQAALEAMAEREPDIVVSDMRMPGMNGAELLDEVRRRHPGTVRLILSGQCDRSAVLDAAGPAHQFLSKPCSAEVLRNTISRIFDVQDQLANAEVRTAVSRLEALPVAANRLRIISDVLSQPEISEAELIRLVTDDSTLFTKCLQLVGSGFLGTQHAVSDPAEIVPALGADTFRSLVFEKRIFPALPEEPILETAADLFQKMSRATAETARRIAAEETDDERTVRLAEMGGRLARIGVAVLAVIDPAKYVQIWRLSVRQKISRIELEIQFFGVHRADVGAYLLGLWGLSPQLVEIVRNASCPRRAPDRTFSALTAVHAACVLVDQAMSEMLHPNHPLDALYLQDVGVISRIDRWQQIAGAVVEEFELAPRLLRYTGEIFSPTATHIPAVL